MLKHTGYFIRLSAALVLTGAIAANASPAAAQCTVNEIIEKMVTPVETDQPAPANGAGVLLQEHPETISNEEPGFVFTPEIPPTQRQVLIRVGKSCAWTSDVSNCTFRRVARMALRGKDAAFIYDQCSD